MKKRVLIIVFIALLGNQAFMMAQTEPDIAMATNEFEDSFYESLLQKGIENYDKAIIALQKCEKLKPDEATVYFELGKNYLSLKDYKNAQNSFEKATQLNPNNKWFWLGIYDVCYQTKNYPLAMETIQKIIPFDEEYKDDLISLYMIANQFDNALSLIDEMNEKFGKSNERELYKSQILSEEKYKNHEIENLMDQITKNPKEESNYIALIALYAKNNDAAKVLQITQQLEKAIPTSEWAQISTFKNYLNQNQPEKAVQAMNVVLANSKIDFKIKHLILNDFLIFVSKNPQFAPDLDKAIAYFKNNPEVDVAKEIGKFYHSKNQFNQAIKYYELSLNSVSQADIETNLLLLQAYSETKQYEPMAKRSAELIETFPTQAEFYFYSGLADNQLQQFKKAKDVLGMGLDYVVDNLTLEANFNIQLGEACNGLGDMKKKETYFAKAEQLLRQKNKL